MFELVPPTNKEKTYRIQASSPEERKRYIFYVCMRIRTYSLTCARMRALSTFYILFTLIRAHAHSHSFSRIHSHSLLIARAHSLTHSLTTKLLGTRLHSHTHILTYSHSSSLLTHTFADSFALSLSLSLSRAHTQHLTEFVAMMKVGSNYQENVKRSSRELDWGF